MEEFVDNRSKYFWWTLGFLLIPVIGVVDHLTGFEIRFLLFYFIPIGIVTWYASQEAGLIAAGVSIIMWLVAEISSEHYTAFFVYLWNTGVNLTIFLIFVLLLGKLREKAVLERLLVERDSLTGALNMKSFFEIAQQKYNQLEKHHHPFTLVYLDLDDFKKINDSLGLAVGDNVLKAVVNGLQYELRQSDIIARLGGDEFALVLSETGPMEAHTVLNRIREQLKSKMESHNWDITFSIGVVTCMDIMYDIEALVKLANSLMQEVKQGSKNGVSFGVYSKAAESLSNP